MTDCACPYRELYAKAAKERDEANAENRELREELEFYRCGGVVRYTPPRTKDRITFIKEVSQ